MIDNQTFLDTFILRSIKDCECCECGECESEILCGIIEQQTNDCKELCEYSVYGIVDILSREI